MLKEQFEQYYSDVKVVYTEQLLEITGVNSIEEAY
jgi:hypothetical protein